MVGADCVAAGATVFAGGATVGGCVGGALVGWIAGTVVGAAAGVETGVADCGLPQAANVTNHSNVRLSRNFMFDLL